MLPATSDVVAKGIAIGSDGQITEIEGDGDNIYGNLTKGSRVIVALVNGATVRYVYGTVK